MGAIQNMAEPMPSYLWALLCPFHYLCRCSNIPNEALCCRNSQSLLGMELIPANHTDQKDPIPSLCTWGMMVTLKRRSWSPIVAMLIPSMRISPLAASLIRNKPRVREDLPAPVRPTMPTYTERSCCELSPGQETFKGCWDLGLIGHL